ncbi:GYDIA family GHMP kinase [Aquimarina sp. RZ0]|uniref:GYDIA family GHMP kinase n=1 Tax=Aquimarina sp. RZ0 TaxID=2607730 RepID=UPI0011F1E5E9|nr:GYDIA family GHMP kinase [Aquimarina sp. RZ0]KAA1246542.1 GHMP kinase [Aquimarina sp. RZ0]
MPKKTFYSHGKLLITGEYLVLDGVTALAIPTRKGQYLTVEENNSNMISWRSLDAHGNCWFQSNFEINDKEFHPLSENNTQTSPEVTKTLLKIFSSARALNSKFLSHQGYTIETRLEFDQQWGLGSSSTLINNIAQWAEVNPFTLLEKSFGGSGYDIACAQHETPIRYTRNGNTPIINKALFNPPFKNDIFFIYLNQKQNSKESIKHYQSLSLKDFDKAEKSINAITEKIIVSQELNEFEKLIDSHEQIISDIIKTPTVKSRLFEDYTNSIKSLGGWGGDFILATGTFTDMNYFRNKGYTTIIPYSEMAFS